MGSGFGVARPRGKRKARLDARRLTAAMGRCVARVLASLGAGVPDGRHMHRGSLLALVVRPTVDMFSKHPRIWRCASACAVLRCGPAPPPGALCEARGDARRAAPWAPTPHQTTKNEHRQDPIFCAAYQAAVAAIRCATVAPRAAHTRPGCHSSRARRRRAQCGGRWAARRTRSEIRHRE